MAKKKTARTTTGRKKTTTTRRKTTARKATGARKAPATKKAKTTRSKSSVRVQAQLTPAERERMVAEAAYYKAEQQGFRPGHELENWLAAEQEIDSQLSQ